MTKWEYEWVRPGDLDPEGMAKMGWRGWEFVGTIGGDWVIFKRPVPSCEPIVVSGFTASDFEALAQQINATLAGQGEVTDDLRT